MSACRGVGSVQATEGGDFKGMSVLVKRASTDVDMRMTGKLGICAFGVGIDTVTCMPCLHRSPQFSHKVLEVLSSLALVSNPAPKRAIMHHRCYTG